MYASVSPLKLTLRISAIILGVAVVAALAVIAGNRLGVILGIPQSGSATTVTAAAPTPAGAPIARDQPNALGRAFPDASYGFVLGAFDHPAPADAAASMGVAPTGILDAAAGLYQANVAGSETYILVTALQYGTAELAQTAGQIMPVPGARELETGSVNVGDREVGTFTRYETDVQNAKEFSAGKVFDPAGIVLWTNGSVRLFAIGPSDLMQNFYLGFSL